MLFQFRATIFWRECLAKDTELRRVVLEGILENLQSDDAITIGTAQSSLDNYLHVYVRAEGNRGKMINIVEQIYVHEGFGKGKLNAWLEKEMEEKVNITATPWKLKLFLKGI